MSIDLSAPEVQDAIKAAVEEATSGLIKKRDELLKEVKEARKKAEISPDDYAKIRDEYDALSEKFNEAQKALKAKDSEIEKLKKSYESESKAVQSLLVDNGINDALTNARILPEFSKAVKAMFKDQATIKIDGDTRSALIGDKSIKDFISEWAGSDEGKHFTEARLNAGGGAKGGSGQGQSAKTITRTEFRALPPQQKIDFRKGGGEVTE